MAPRSSDGSLMQCAHWSSASMRSLLPLPRASRGSWTLLVAPSCCRPTCRDWTGVTSLAWWDLDSAYRSRSTTTTSSPLRGRQRTGPRKGARRWCSYRSASVWEPVCWSAGVPCAVFDRPPARSPILRPAHWKSERRERRSPCVTTSVGVNRPWSPNARQSRSSPMRPKVIRTLVQSSMMPSMPWAPSRSMSVRSSTRR